MRDILRLEHSAEVDVSAEFAWQYRTDVGTWNDPPATFSIHGPFEAGARGTTLLPGQEPIHWHIREIQPGKSFVLEMPLDRAALSFEWCVDQLSAHRTKLTQIITLSGENAEAYAAQVEAGFKPTLADGMRRVASEMAAAEKSRRAG